MSYMQKVFSQSDDERQKRCLLIIDEAYVKSCSTMVALYLEKLLTNQTNLLLLCFMLIGLSGGPKVLCRMLSVKELDAIFLIEQTDASRM